MANQELIDYIIQLNQLNQAIDRAVLRIEQFRSMPKNMVGAFIPPAWLNQIQDAKILLNSLMEMRTRLVTGNAPVGSNVFPFRTSGTGANVYGTGFTLPAGAGVVSGSNVNRSIVPYDPNYQSNVRAPFITGMKDAAAEIRNNKALANELTRMQAAATAQRIREEPVQLRANEQQRSILMMEIAQRNYTNALNRITATLNAMPTTQGPVGTTANALGNVQLLRAQSQAANTTQSQILQQAITNRAGGVQAQGINPALQAQLNAVGGQGMISPAQQKSWQQGVRWYAQIQQQISDAWGPANQYNALRNEYLNNPRFKSSREYAERAGYQGVIPQMKEVGTSGVTRLNYDRVSPGGIPMNMQLFNTPAGKNIESVSRQFQTLTSAIGRDLRELTKWSVAIALIYGPLNALKTLYADMVENQTRLANAMIATTDAGMRVTEVFNSAKSAADAMGTGVSDTINSFTQAYRATGNLGTVQQRVATTGILLKDSLVLSTLAGMEEATAIDTLAASLRQTNTPLNEGSTLLDKWVKTTQVANVDLQTLATGFAVLGDAAETAGMSVDEINGLLAAIAETGIGTSKEVANAAKAIVAGFYSDKAVKQLNLLGIAVKDAEGNLRDFNSIATELYQQRQLGLISDTSFQTTMRDIGGGGNRRQAAVTTLIENYARVQQVAALSADAGGEASAAMGRRLDTVQVSTTRLNNAFQSLSMSLGNEGGLLDLFGKVLDVATGISNAFSNLTSVMGKAGPVLMTTLASGLLIKSQGGLAGDVFGSKMDKIFTSIMPGLYPMKYSNAANGPSVQQGAFGRGIPALLSSTPSMWNVGAGALIGGILPALGNLANRNEDPNAGLKAAFNVGGSIAGMLISTLMGASPLIGAVIGSAIGEGIVTTATQKGSVASILAETGASGYKIAPKTAYSADKGTEALYSAVGGGQAWLGKLFTGTAGIFEKMISGKSQETFAYETVVNEANKGNPRAKQALEEFNKSVQSYQLTNPDKFNLPTTSVEQKQVVEMQAHGGMLTEMRKQAEAKLLTQLQQGDITSANYTSKRESLSTFEERATKFVATFGDSLVGKVSGINTIEDAYASFLDLIISGTPEAMQTITDMSSELFDAQRELTMLQKPGIDANAVMVDLGDGTQTASFWIDFYTKRVEYLTGILPALVEEGTKAAMALKVNAPSVLNLREEAYTPEDYAKINTLAKQQQFTELRQLNQEKTPTGEYVVSDADINAYIASQDEFGVYVLAFGEAVATLTGGVSEGAFKTAATQLFNEGKLTSGPEIKTKTQNPMMLDINSSQFPLLQQYTNQAMVALKSIPGFTPKDEALQVFGKDWIGGVIHGDQIALRLAMEKLIGIEEKQLDGIYNLPDGSFFSVFLTDEWMKLMQKGGTSGGTGISGGGTTTETGYGMGGGVMSDVGGSTMPGIKIPKGIGYKYGFLGRSGSTYSVSPENIRPSILDRKYSLPYDERGLAIKEAQQAKYGTQPGYVGLGADKFFKLLGITPVGTGWGGGIGNTNTQPVSRTSLNLNTTTTVQLDGRVIASIIKVYLAEDLARMTAGYGKSAKDYVGGS